MSITFFILNEVQKDIYNSLGITYNFTCSKICLIKYLYINIRS